MAKAIRTKKTRKNQLAVVRERLDRQREEILSMYEHDLRIGQWNNDEGAEDLVDRANNAYNREFMLSLSDSERQILLAIEEAITRVDGGHYGVCTHCEEKIAHKRLQAVPWARYCVDCQELSEQGMLYES